MKEKFKSIKPTGPIRVKLEEGRYWEAEKAVILNAIIEVSRDYARQGYQITLRQLYYQLVKANVIPNHDKVYKKLSSLKDDVVYAGLVDWNIFEDRGRVPKRAYFEDSVKGSIERTKSQYALDRQKGQPKHIEVWTEKDAISNILSRVTTTRTIRLVVNKGYSSSTAMYGAYVRFMEAIEQDQKIVVLYFGDHDPSGLDMVRDIEDRIIFFMKEGQRRIDIGHDVMKWCEDNEDFILDNYYHDSDYYTKSPNPDEKEMVLDLYRIFFENHFEIKHIGLTMEQIEEFNPPPNPAKITDPRAKGYIRKYGQVSWEVDALTPSNMTSIVRDAIEEEMDDDIYTAVLQEEDEHKEKLEALIEDLDLDDEETDD